MKVTFEVEIDNEHPLCFRRVFVPVSFQLDKEHDVREELIINMHQGRLFEVGLQDLNKGDINNPFYDWYIASSNAGIQKLTPRSISINEDIPVSNKIIV